MARRPKLAKLDMELAVVSQRSRFALWLSVPKNLAELQQRLRKHGSNWTVVAEWANASGLTGARGHPLTSVAAKRAYERAKNPPKPGKPPPMPQPAEDKKPLPAVKPAAPDYLTPEPELAPEQEFPVKFAKLRKHPPQKPPEDK